jgi:hypothetical protein
LFPRWRILVVVVTGVLVTGVSFDPAAAGAT